MSQKIDNNKKLDYYLNTYYPVTLTYDSNGWYVAEIKALPGCVAQGKTQVEVLDNIEAAKQLWLEEAYNKGLSIPLTPTEADFSGRVLVRMPRSLHKQLVESASEEGVSLNQYMVMLLSKNLVSLEVNKDITGLTERLQEIISQLNISSANPVSLNPSEAIVLQGHLFPRLLPVELEPSNSSQLLVTLEATLEAIKQIREILRESQRLSPSVYNAIEIRLVAVERGLSSVKLKPSQLLVTLEATLEAIKQIREILIREFQRLPPSVYNAIEIRLVAVERGLTGTTLNDFEYQFSSSSHIYDEDDEVATLWKQLVEFVRIRPSYWKSEVGPISWTILRDL